MEKSPPDGGGFALREKLRPEKTRINQAPMRSASARIRCLADSRGLANSSGLFTISLIKIRMKLYKRPRIGMNEGWRDIVFRADFTGLETAAKTAKFLTAPINMSQV